MLNINSVTLYYVNIRSFSSSKWQRQWYYKELNIMENLHVDDEIFSILYIRWLNIYNILYILIDGFRNSIIYSLINLLLFIKVNIF